MKIDIDFEILLETNMSADDFTYLYLLYKKEYNYIYPRVRQLTNKQTKMGVFMLGVSEKGECKFVKN